MRGHDDLAMARLIHPPHQLQKFHLARRRQRGFRFVEDVDALPLAALLEEAHESLAVRKGQESRMGAIAFVEIPGDGKEALMRISCPIRTARDSCASSRSAA